MKMLSFSLPLLAFSLLHSPTYADGYTSSANFDRTIVGAERIAPGLYALDTEAGTTLRVKAPDASIVADFIDADAFSQDYLCRLEPLDSDTYRLLECSLEDPQDGR